MSDPIRYRNYGGALVPDPEGQWVHVSDLGTKAWNLDPVSLTGSGLRPDDDVRLALDAVEAELLGTEEWSGDELADAPLWALRVIVSDLRAALSGESGEPKETER